MKPSMTDTAKAEYASKLVQMDSKTLVREIATEVLAAGYERIPGLRDQRCSLLYAECKRREAAYLYQRGYNIAARDAGVDVSDNALARARTPDNGNMAQRKLA